MKTCDPKTVRTFLLAAALFVAETPLRSANAGSTEFDCEGVQVFVGTWPGYLRIIKATSGKDIKSPRHSYHQHYVRLGNIQYETKTGKLTLNGKPCSEIKFAD